MAKKRHRKCFTPTTEMKQHVVVGNLSSMKKQDNLDRLSELISRQPDLTLSQIAERLGMNIHTIRKYKKLLRIPTEVQKKLEKLKWLEYFFPDMKPIDLAQKIGCSLTTIYALKKKIGSKVKKYKSNK